MKKFYSFLLICIIFGLFGGGVEGYTIQPGDNALLSKIYDRMDVLVVEQPQKLVDLHETMGFLMIKYGGNPKSRYFLEKIAEYTEERLFRATESKRFQCLDAYVQEGDSVSIEYVLKTADGRNISLAKGEYTYLETRPLVFNPGKDQIIQGVEDAVIGEKQGDRAGVEIDANDAYGSHDGKLVMTFPRQEIEKYSSKEVVPGNRVFTNVIIEGEEKRLQGFVKLVDTEQVTIDFNLPLAGKDLHGVITVVSIFKNCGKF